MDLERLDDWCEKAILGLVLAVLAFAPLALGAVRPREFILLELLTATAAVIWVVRLWIQPGVRLFWPPIVWLVLLFAGYAGLQLAWAPVSYIATEEVRRVLLYTALFLIILNNVNRQESPSWVVSTLLTVGALISIYAIYQFATESNRVWTFIRPDVYARRGSGTYICPNHLAGFLEVLLPIGLAYTLIGRVGHKTRILAGYSTVMILLGIGVSISRGGWVAAGLSLLLFLVLLSRQPSHRLPVFFALILFLMGAGYLATKSEAITQRFERMLKPGQMEYALQRFYLWKPTTQMWLDHVWTGVGPAHFDHRFREYRPPDYQVRPLRAHNDYLNLLADWGAAGGLLVAGIWIALLVGVVQTWKFVQRSNDLGSRTSNRFAFVLGGACGLTALLFHSMVDFNFHVPANAITAVVVMALITVHQRFATDSHWVTAGWLTRGVLTLMIGGAVYVWGDRGWTAWKEQRFLAEADRQNAVALELAGRLKQAQSSDELDTSLLQKLSREYAAANKAEFAALESAHLVDSTNPETAYRLGESLRLSVWQRVGGKPREVLPLAREYFSKASVLNPFDPYPLIRQGMCLDYLKRFAEAEPYYEKAVKLDPNGYYTAAHMGWHFAQKREWAVAKKWFEKSLQLKPPTMPDANPIAYTYLQIVNRMLASPEPH